MNKRLKSLWQTYSEADEEKVELLNSFAFSLVFCWTPFNVYFSILLIWIRNSIVVFSS